jgi:hypothetical protein
MSKFNYEPPKMYQEIQRTYHQSVPNNLLQNDIGEDVSRALKYKKRHVDLYRYKDPNQNIPRTSTFWYRNMVVNGVGYGPFVWTVIEWEEYWKLNDKYWNSVYSTAHTGVHHCTHWCTSLGGGHHTRHPQRAASTQQVLEFGYIVLTHWCTSIWTHTRHPPTRWAACSINATSASEGATGRLGDDRQQLYAVLSRISLELLMLLVASAAMRAYCVGLYDVHHLLDVHHATSKSLCNTENGCGATGVRLERFIGMKQ